jgi:hypothetical protein
MISARDAESVAFDLADASIRDILYGAIRIVVSSAMVGSRRS